MANEADSLSALDKDDDGYFSDLSGLLALRLYTITKTNNLVIVNGENRLLLKPNGQTNLGIGLIINQWNWELHSVSLNRKRVIKNM